MSEFSDQSMLEAALRYVRMGWPVFPLGIRGKKPMIPEGQGGGGCKDATLNEEKAREWWTKWPQANIGLATGHRFIALDKDPRDGGDDSLDFLVRHHGPLPKTIEQTTGTGGGHYLFQQPDFRVRNSQGNNGGIAQGIDIRGYHGYIVAPPSIHPETGRAYCWEGMEELEQQKLAPAPGWLLDWLKKHSERASAPPDPAKATVARFAKGQRHNGLLKIAGSMRARGLTADEIFALLKAVNEKRCDPPYDEAHIRKMAESAEQSWSPNDRFSLFRAVPEPQAESDGRDELSVSPADVEAAIDQAIEKNDLVGAIRLAPDIAKLKVQFRAVIKAKLKVHFKREFPESIQREFDRAIQEAAGENERANEPPAPPVPPPDASAPPGGGPDLRWCPLTDAGNGERLRLLFGEEIRYCIEMRKWLVWDGKRWAVDEMNVMRQRVKQMARLLYAQSIGMPKIEAHARASESFSAGTAALGYAATEPGVPISAVDLDQQPFLLNCLNGVVNLRKGELLPHSREFLITKLCPVAYDPQADCPKFKAFIEWAMGQNPDAELTERTAHLVGFLQRAFGYSLTADVTEKALFIFYGDKGNNGKTTLLTLFRHLLGRDFSTQISIETVMTAAKNQDATMRADLADLRGTRFAITSEVEKEHKLNSRLIKYLTAGMSDIKSCRKYENPIEFPASHKLFMDCNHRPRINDTDDAIWKRLKLVPFDVRISDDELDRQLPDKLRAEYPGVLTWAVRGCMSWFRDGGLGDPPEVSTAGQEWREHDDPLKDFIEDCCEMAPELFVGASELATAYDWWAKQNKERFSLNREAFNERLLSKGYRQNRGRRNEETGKQFRTWEGIQLRGDVTTAMRKTVSGPRWLNED
jgi:P4 family phage/plasmid primase-like protien